MPAAGKSRKGVFRMKKLLLVMLVPVLVLGIMSCGSTPETGDEVPYALHGTWVNNLDGVTNAPPGALPGVGIFTDPSFIFAANEMTIVLPQAGAGVNGYVPGEFLQLAFVAVYGGEKDNFMTVATTAPNNYVDFTVTITRILDGVEWGVFRFRYSGDSDTIEVLETIRIDTSVVPYYEFNELLQEGAIFWRAII
jgi:hypothetical protein